jgi:hypothetical protein
MNLLRLEEYFINFAWPTSVLHRICIIGGQDKGLCDPVSSYFLLPGHVINM